MKYVFVLLTCLFTTVSFADESIWVYSDGSGWSFSEFSACRQAERDAEWELESDCRLEAGTNQYRLSSVYTSRCSCYESGNNFRCRTTGRGLCTIYEDDE